MTELTNEQIIDIVRNDDKMLTKIKNEFEKQTCGSHQKRDIVPQAIHDKYGKTGSWRGKWYCSGQDEMISKLIRKRIDAYGMTASKRIMTKDNGYRATALYDYSDKQYEIYCWAAERIIEVLEQIGKVGETYRDKNGALVSEKGVVLVDSWDDVTADYHVIEEGKT